jgi:hypothetical protein
MRTWAALAGLGAGVGAYFLFFGKALASEDRTGTDVHPDEARMPPPGAPLPPGAPPAPPPTPATAAKGTTIGRRAVEILLSPPYFGATEEPKGSNRGPVVDQIIRGVQGDGEWALGKPWCGRTVRFAYEKAAQDLGLPAPFDKKMGSLAAVDEWPKKFKGFTSDTPRTGMAAVIAGHHIALVTRVDGDTIYTVDGNHNDAVATVKRPRSKFSTFVDVEAYLASKAKPADRVAGLDLLGAEAV